MYLIVWLVRLRFLLERRVLEVRRGLIEEGGALRG
jgi:hypothetical protein